MANYLVIQENDESAAYAFKVTLEGYRPETYKSQRVQYTVTGKLDIQSGANHKGWIYTIKLYHEDTGGFSVTPGAIMTAASVNWGDLTTLITLFDANVPPENKYRFRDLDDNEYYVFFDGKMTTRPLTPKITGDSAYMEVTVLLKGSQ